MKKTLWAVRIIVFGLLVLFLILPSTIYAGTRIDGKIVISADVEHEVSPAVAYNSQRQEYLVVWYNDRVGCDDIRAQRVSKNGALIGPPFYIAAECPADRRYPDVAYNSTANQYLVVWEQYEPSSGYSIHGRRVSALGVQLGEDIVIRGAGINLYTPATPAVAYGYTYDKYLVVWEETWHPIPITYDISGQFVTVTGAIEESMFTISTGTDLRGEPDVAYNRNTDRYLVVWQKQSGDLFDIYGQQVNGSGGLFQGDIRITYFTVPTTAPAVAALRTSPTVNKYMVVYELHYSPTDWDIYGSLISEDGTPSPYWSIASMNYSESSPAVAASEANNQYLVAWRSSIGGLNQPVYGRALSHSGLLLGREAVFEGISTNYPVLANGPNGDFLVVWQDQPLASTLNIYGQLWGNRAYLPLLKR